jgi:glycosyltransferase involved in cell wall biosynthesis
LADEIVIVDTGSIDGTHKLIEDWINKYKVAHVVKFEKVGAKFHDIDGDFDFGAARTYAFSLATKDYVAWIDAADLVVHAKETKEIFKEVTANNQNVYFVIPTQISESLHFPRTRITPRKDAKMVGRVHEFMQVQPKLKKCMIHFPIVNRANGVSLDRNLRILLKDWEIDKSRRNAFYLANTYYGLGNKKEAFKWFKYRAFEFKDTKEIFKEERFKSLEMACELGLKLSRKKDVDVDEIPFLADEMIKYMPSRYEGYFYRAKYFLEEQKWEQALKFLNMYKVCRVPKDVKLWLNPQIYKNATYIMDIRKCETAIEYKGVLKPEEIFDLSEYDAVHGVKKSKKTYKFDNNQYIIE